MKNEDLIPFWTVSAQVIPVLALALVLEARATGRQLSKKKTFAKVALRRFWGYVFYSLSFILGTSMLYSLSALAFPLDPSAELSSTRYFILWYVSGSIWLGLLFAFTIPLTMIHSTLLGDRVSIFERWNPISRFNRLRRSARRLGDFIENELKETRNLRHKILIVTADNVLFNAKAHQRIKRIKSLLTSSEMTLAEKSRFREDLRENESFLKLNAEQFVDLKNHLEELDRERSMLLGHSETLKSIVHWKNQTIDETHLKELRKRLSEVSGT